MKRKTYAENNKLVREFIFRLFVWATALMALVGLARKL